MGGKEQNQATSFLAVFWHSFCLDFFISLFINLSYLKPKREGKEMHEIDRGRCCYARPNRVGLTNK